MKCREILIAFIDWVQTASIFYKGEELLRPTGSNFTFIDTVPWLFIELTLDRRLFGLQCVMHYCCIFG